MGLEINKIIKKRDKYSICLTLTGLIYFIFMWTFIIYYGKKTVPFEDALIGGLFAIFIFSVALFLYFKIKKLSNMINKGERD